MGEDGSIEEEMEVYVSVQASQNARVCEEKYQGKTHLA
jgi:hypothetical protein